MSRPARILLVGGPDDLTTYQVPDAPPEDWWTLGSARLSVMLAHLDRQAEAIGTALNNVTQHRYQRRGQVGDTAHTGEPVTYIFEYRGPA